LQWNKSLLALQVIYAVEIGL